MSLQASGRAALAGALGVTIVAVLGAGVATAADGGSLVLGHHNTATKTTELKDPHGTPLELVGKKSDAPLKVNSSKEVTHLNAALLGGQSASSLQSSGSDGHLYDYSGVSLPVDGALPFPGLLVVKTASLPAGTYFVDAYAWVDSTGASSGHATHCFIGQNTAATEALATASTDSSGYAPLSTTWPVTLTTAGPIGEYCFTQATSAVAYQAAITATKIAHATVGTNINVVQTGIHPIDKR